MPPKESHASSASPSAVTPASAAVGKNKKWKKKQQQQQQQPTAAAAAATTTTASSSSKQKKEKKMTETLIKNAPKLLQQVDDNFLKANAAAVRQYPTFDRDEMRYGPVLGVGGFGIVFELDDLQLKKSRRVESEEDKKRCCEDDGDDDGDKNNNNNTAGSAVSCDNTSVSFHLHAAAADQERLRSDKVTLTTTVALTGNNARVAAIKVPKEEDDDDDEDNDNDDDNNDNGDNERDCSDRGEGERGGSDHTGTESTSSGGMMKKKKNHHHRRVVSLDNSHYDLNGAREFMKERIKRNGCDARYAVKRLHRDLTDLERIRGMIDLAMEAKYLSVLWHPNVVKMRAVSSGPVLDRGFFIVLDRLYETLEEKLESWYRMDQQYRKQHRGGIGGRSVSVLLSSLLLGCGGGSSTAKSAGNNNHHAAAAAAASETDKILVERVIVAYDLAAAFWYLHQNRLVYRDIKPDNVGFDVRGDVKVFDFGLTKCLHEQLKSSSGYGYRLTAMTGSVPYMAPEVVAGDPYDCKCDVYSFAVLLWEILSMKRAYRGYSRREYFSRVCRRGERMSVPRYNQQWPPLSKMILPEAWDGNPAKRPDMKRVAAMIRGDLNEMTTDPSVRERTNHMRERSRHSYRLSRKDRLQQQQHQQQQQQQQQDQTTVVQHPPRKNDQRESLHGVEAQ